MTEITSLDHRRQQREAPTCPRCTTRTQVEPLGSRVYDARHYCGNCHTVFVGSQHEWEANRRWRDGEPHTLTDRERAVGLAGVYAARQAMADAAAAIQTPVERTNSRGVA